MTPAARTDDESFTHKTQQGMTVLIRRATLLRWVWVFTTSPAQSKQWSPFAGAVTDDFGNLQPVNYIHASLAGSKNA